MACYATSVITVRLPINRAPYFEYCRTSILKRRSIGTGTHSGVTGAVVSYGQSMHAINHPISSLLGRTVTGSTMVVGAVVDICIMSYGGTGSTRAELEQLLSCAYPTVRFRLRDSQRGRFILLFETSGDGLLFGAYAKLLGFV